MTPAQILKPARFADAKAAIRHVFVRDLELMALIGVYRHEHEAKQRIRINLDLAVGEDGAINDELSNVVSYETVVEDVRALVAAGHINLVETLAEKIAALCLRDARVRVARVRVEKPDVIADAAGVGVEIERTSPTK